MTVYNQGKPKDAEFFGINLPFFRFLKLVRFIIFLPMNRYSTLECRARSSHGFLLISTQGLELLVLQSMHLAITHSFPSTSRKCQVRKFECPPPATPAFGGRPRSYRTD